MIFEPDQINMPVRSLKRRRPDIYQLLLPELEALSPEQPLPADIPSKYFGQIFQKFLNSFQRKFCLKTVTEKKNSFISVQVCITILNIKRFLYQSEIT